MDPRNISYKLLVTALLSSCIDISLDSETAVGVGTIFLSLSIQASMIDLCDDFVPEQEKKAFANELWNQY